MDKEEKYALSFAAVCVGGLVVYGAMWRLTVWVMGLSNSRDDGLYEFLAVFWPATLPFTLGIKFPLVVGVLTLAGGLVWLRHTVLRLQRERTERILREAGL